VNWNWNGKEDRESFIDDLDVNENDIGMNQSYPAGQKLQLPPGL
jgi:hypothetical protein